MTEYLISFPSGEMNIPDGGLEEVSQTAHAVVREAKEAGVWVFGGDIDESVPPVRVAADGTVIEGTYPQTKQLEGGYSILELETYDDAWRWAAKFAAGCRCPQEVRAFAYDPES